MSAPRPGAALPAPDLPLLGALYVLEASVWLAIVASYKAGGTALPALPGGVSGLVFLVACVVGLMTAVVIARRHRRTRHEPRRFAFTVALNVAPVILLLAVGEVAVRLMTVPTPRGLVFVKTVLLPHSWHEVAARNAAVLRRLRTEGSHLMPDELLGWVLGPGRVSRDGLYASSAEGVRSAQPGERALATDRPRRVALVGDSFTFGFDVRFEDSWGHRLERALGPDVQVVNFGVEAYGLDQAYLRYLRDARPWQPDVVILGVIDHDLQRSMSVYFFLSFPGWDYPFAKPRFVSHEGHLSLLNSPLPSPDAIAATRAIAELPHVDHEPGFRADEWRWHPLDHSYLHRLVASKYRALVFPRSPDEPVLDLNRQIVRAFLDRARAEGSRPLVVYFPSDRNFRALAKDPRWRSLAQTMLDDAGIPYTDTTPCLTPLAPAERFPADGRNHFAPPANAAVAACLTDSVRALLAQALERVARSSPR